MAPVQIPIDGILDLHTFQAADIAALMEDYLEACREKDILRVRIVHGKGTGVLRTRVHRLLEHNPAVASFRLADGVEGGWGATIAVLFPPSNRSS